MVILDLNHPSGKAEDYETQLNIPFIYCAITKTWKSLEGILTA
jgi:hypothetical protein